MKLPCKNLGCTACCQWGDNPDELKPDPTLMADDKGNCTMLTPGIGCSIHDSEHYPEACAKFDCRELLKHSLQSPFMRILVAAIRLQAYTTAGKVEVPH